MNKLHIYAITATITATLSFIGSTLLIVTILRSKKRLSVPYRRITFGISVFDILQSVGYVTNIFLSPKESDPWAIGNTTTCDIQGFLMTTGMIGVPMYLCSLCVYYYCIIVLNMRTHVFKRIEPFLHAAPILYSVGVCAYALVNQYMNSVGTVCTITGYPRGCNTLGLECTRGEGAMDYYIRFFAIPNFILFIVICGIMAVIACSARRLERRNRRYSISPSAPDDRRRSTSITLRDSIQMVSTWFSVTKDNETDGDDRNNETFDDIRNTQPETPAIASPTASNMHLELTRETTKQALLYVGMYVLTYGGTWISLVHVLATGNPRRPFVYGLVIHFLQPLQGFCNIFVYCRPHIVSLQKKYPGEYTWCHAFKVVLKSGADSCRTTVEEDRRQEQNNTRLFGFNSLSEV